MGDAKFAKEDFEIAIDKTLGARVSVNVVSPDSPATVPANNCDVIYAWCYSIMYDHASMSKCFHLAKVVNQLIKGEITSEVENTIVLLVQQIINLQYSHVNSVRVA